MNIRKTSEFQDTYISDDPIQQLFESQVTKMDNNQEKEIEKVLDLKSNQFKFDCGAVMGSLTSPMDNMIFGLKHYAKITTNVEDFVIGVAGFLAAGKIKLTSTDIDKLKAHYNKYAELVKSK